jgi:hypothetical protein
MNPFPVRSGSTWRTAGAFSCALLLACATRSVPRDPPASSAASPRAEAAPATPAAVVLREDPPLPGEADADWGLWPGLEPDVRAPEGHEDHRGHAPRPDGAAGPAPHEHDAHDGAAHEGNPGAGDAR